MNKLMSDNVMWFTLGSISIPALAVIMVGLNLLIRDGPNVTAELQYLEALGIVGAVLHGVYGIIHTYFASKKQTQPPQGS